MSTFLSPVVKSLVIEHNIDVSRIQGTGKEGRITKRDIEIWHARMESIPTASHNMREWTM